MKINKISIKNLIGIKLAEIESEKQIIFISGNNGSGKSSIADAVAMALTGDLCRVSMKKESAWLLNSADAGMVEVNADDNRQFYTSISKSGITAKGQGIDVSPALPYVLHPSKFADATADERRKLLFEISGCKTTKEDVARRLIDRGIDAKTFEAILPMLRAGFPEAQKEAQTKAREEKAIWKNLTKEVYGEKKAEAWKSPVTGGNLEEIRNAVINNEKELHSVDADLETLNQRLGVIKSDKDKASARNAKIVRLRTQVEMIDRIKSKLESDKRSVIDWQAMVEKARMSSSGIGQDDAVCHCPECGSELIFVNKDKKLIPHGDLRGNEDVAVKLPEYERSLELFQNSVKNGERDLANAEAAKDQLAMIEDEMPAVDDAAISDLTAKIYALKAQKKALIETINNLIAEEKALREADKTTAKAYEHHKQVESWEKIAAAFAPDGIPGELLQDAIRPFNDRLKNTAEISGWMVPTITIDIDINAGGRPYALLSESEKWRTDCLLSEAISHISGLKFMIIDRMDVLDGTSRGDFFVWLSELALLNEIDTVLVMGTLKSEQAITVAKAFEKISVHWMQDGVLEHIVTQEEEID